MRFRRPDVLSGQVFSWSSHERPVFGPVHRAASTACRRRGDDMRARPPRGRRVGRRRSSSRCEVGGPWSMTGSLLLSALLSSSRRAGRHVQGSCSSINLLVFSRHPLHVSRFVVTDITEAPQRHVRRTLAHVLQEGSEVVPPLAYGDTRAPVPSEPLVVRILATPKHRPPRVIGRRRTARCGVTMFKAC
jgi:hypothetical protein